MDIAGVNIDLAAAAKAHKFVLVEAEQLHRFLGTRSGRKSQYARLLAAALDPAQVPRPLDCVLAHG